MSIPSEHLTVLQKILTRLAGRPINWVITGSLGWALQGVPVPVNDIDLQADEPGAYEIERCLAEFSVRPVGFSSSERIRSHFGRLEIDGVTVEIMGDMQHMLSDGTWKPPVALEQHRRWIERDGMRLPVLSLEYEYRAYLLMGRTEKAEKLRKWLDEQ